MKICVCGSRNFNNSELVIQVLTALFNASGEIEIISGGATGPDTTAVEYAKIRNVPTKVFLPNWNKFGKAAGAVRNKQMVDEVELVLAFWDGKSKGTKITIDYANSIGVQCYIISLEGEI